MIAMTQDHPTEALRFLDRALEANPDFLEARQYRALLMARLGQAEPARREVNRCLGRDPRSGATLYVAACVASQASKSLADPRAAEQALDLLEKARLQGADITKAAADPDLEPLRAHPRFNQLLAAAPRTDSKNVAHE
jgi:tetratricopeptide (TPR) repeat protein